jgi:regulatory protein
MEETQESDYKKCRRYALYLLNRRAYTAHKLKEKLKEKEYSRDSREKVAQECIDQGCLNDRLWAESFVRVQIAKKYGRTVIAQKLRMKGIEGDLIQEVLEKYLHEDSSQCIQELLETRYRNRDLEDPREKQKVIASLLRRGFDYSSIRKHIHSEI